MKGIYPAALITTIIASAPYGNNYLEWHVVGVEDKLTKKEIARGELEAATA